jgi:RimJ/RimL family protein N-acetyltransferase
VTAVIYPPVIEGHGLQLRPWDEALVRQMAAWSEHGFPYHAFDLAHLRNPRRASSALAFARENGPHRHFVACEDGTAVGRVSVNLRDEAGLYLWAVHVPPEHQGRGVARRMLATLMTWLQSSYSEDFVLTSNAFATRAHRTYEALGFRITETRWHFDREVAQQLWTVSVKEREPVIRHARFIAGRWEVRTHVFTRPNGAAIAPLR